MKNKMENIKKLVLYFLKVFAFVLIVAFIFLTFTTNLYTTK